MLSEGIVHFCILFLLLRDDCNLLLTHTSEHFARVSFSFNLNLAPFEICFNQLFLIYSKRIAVVLNNCYSSCQPHSVVLVLIFHLAGLFLQKLKCAKFRV